MGLSGIRISMTFSLIWVQELVGREIERRTVFLVLAYPMPRAAYILGRYLGILLLAAAAILLLGVICSRSSRFRPGATSIHMH